MSSVQITDSVLTRWWLVVLQGVIAVVLGVLLFGRPGEALLVVAFMIGIQATALGILDIFAAISGRTGRSRMWTLLSGLLMLAAGLFFLTHPLLAGAIHMSVIVYIVGALFVLAGFADIKAGRADEFGHRSRSWAGFFIGILKILFGVFLFVYPLFNAAVLLNVAAFWTIVLGLVMVFVGVNIRGARKRLAL